MTDKELARTQFGGVTVVCKESGVYVQDKNGELVKLEPVSEVHDEKVFEIKAELYLGCSGQ
jgi:hypothetical protein